MSNFLIVINNANPIVPFLLRFANFLIRQGHTCRIYVSTRAAERFLESYQLDNRIKVIRKRELVSKIDIENPDKRETRLEWLDFHASWDRKIFWHSMYKANYKEYVRIISMNSKIVERVVNDVKPNFILQEPPANLLTFLFHKEAIIRNIKYIGLIISKIPGHTDIFDSKFTNSHYEKYYSVNLSEEEKSFYSKLAMDFATEKLKPSYANLPHTKAHKMSLFRHYINRIRIIPERIYLYKHRKEMIKEGDYEGIATLNSTFKGPRMRLNRKFNYLTYVKKFKIPSCDELKEKDYYLFPLHYQPEASTSAQAPFYCDLRSTIRYISFSLPFSYKLLVKEHPHGVGIRGQKFFKEILKLPNVELISPDTSNEMLIRYSKGVITLTSTLGLQAAVLGKPVYILGDVFYKFHPNVKKVSNFEELNLLLNYEEIKPLFGDELETANAKFFYAYHKVSADADIINYEGNTDENFEDLLRKIENLL